jgi:hypothetical protein
MTRLFEPEVRTNTRPVFSREAAETVKKKAEGFGATPTHPNLSALACRKNPDILALPTSQGVPKLFCRLVSPILSRRIARVKPRLMMLNARRNWARPCTTSASRR